MVRRAMGLLVLAAWLGGCDTTNGGVADTGAPPLDTGAVVDTATVVDTAAVADTGAVAVPDTAAVADTGTVPDTATVADTVTDTGGPFVLPEGLSGAQASNYLATVTFSEVLDHDGANVPPSALLGRATVLWFYPMANTGG